MSIILFEVIFMPIPAKILAVERPKGTVVKQSHGRYLVIKRTSKRVNGKPKPVDLGTVGEIINGAYVEIRKEPRRHRNEVDIKDYGEFALCNKACGDLLQELARSFSIQDAKRIFVIAMLRTMDQDIKNRDLQFAYETSYISEIYPGVHLSENTVSDFLEKTGMAYRHIHQFMQSRMDAFGGGHLVIDGMLKDNNSSTNTFSEWSRKGARKGSRDINLIFAYDPETKEPVAVKPYPGNMLDLTALQDFVAEYAITSGILIMDKGFTSNENIGKLREIGGVSFVLPLKQSSAKIRDNGLLGTFSTVLDGYHEATVLYKKVALKNSFLYAFRDPKCAYEQEVGYIAYAKKKGTYSEEKFLSRKSAFGLIVFESASDLDPLDVYEAYMGRWEIEVMFNLYKNIVDLDTVNVHGDYRMYATEFINYISVIMAGRVKKYLAATKVDAQYSYAQVFRLLSKYKKIRVADSDQWVSNKVVKYVSKLISALGV